VHLWFSVLHWCYVCVVGGWVGAPPRRRTLCQPESLIFSKEATVLVFQNAIEAFI